ncbi:Glycosylphosphatidylinositol (GPI) anchor assembly protein [Dipsacomyces acuminosporus]|nr:Glycosylphosphatidylinositol (GPI) anchor assembly protein [Dipsacomyces acuminosporus]
MPPKIPDHKLYPIEPNAIELVLAGMASALALIDPRKGLDLYEHPVRYMLFSATVTFGYYAIMAFADIYCFRVPDGKRKHKSIGARASKVLTAGLATLASAVPISIVFVLFGAPATSQHLETFLAALIVSLLAVTPSILTLKADFGAWRKALLSNETKTVPEKWAAGLFWCTMVTSWMCAYFVPMDWDRPWQKWPIPIVGGAYLGNLIGLLYVLIRCFVIPVARVDFEESERAKRQMAKEWAEAKKTQETKKDQ